MYLATKYVQVPGPVETRAFDDEFVHYSQSL